MPTVAAPLPPGPLHVQPTIEDVRNGAQAYHRSRRGPWWAAVLVLAVWALDLTMYFRKEANQHLNFTTLLHVFVVGSYILGTLGLTVGALLLWKPSVKSIERWRPDLLKAFTLAFGPETVTRSSEYGSTNIPWKDVKTIHATPHGLLVSHGFMAAAWFWVPGRFLEGTGLQTEILRLASQHKVRIKRIGSAV